MKHLLDHFIIDVPSVYDESISASGLIKTNHAWFISKERDRYGRKLRYGTIVSAPIGYSDKNYMPLDSGIPNYKLYIGHDAIQKQVNMGYKEWQNFKHYYHPGIKESFDFLSMQHFGDMIDAKVGEKVYFHPRVTEQENKVSETLYRAAADSLICVVGDRIRMQAGWVLVKPHIDEQLEENGLIFRLEGEARMLEGTVVHVRDGAEVKIGDEILHQDDANWSFIVDGIEYYAMMENDICMKMVEV